MNSCDSLVQAWTGAGLIDLAPQNLVDEYFASTQEIDPNDLCSGAREVEHSHVFTSTGEFYSYNDSGKRVDNGTYAAIDDKTLTFPQHGQEWGYSPINVRYTIDGDTLSFDVVVPDPCVENCRQATAWAIAAFYPGQFERVQ